MKLKQWIAALVCVASISLPVWVLHHSGDAGFRLVGFLFTGQAFADRPIVTGGALDQGSLQKELFILSYSVVVLCPFLALVRWLRLSGPRSLQVFFLGASLIALIHPFSILTLFTWDVVRYAWRMGFTPMRMVGITIAFAAYGALAVFAAWLWGIKIKRPNQASHAPSEPALGAVSSAREG